MVHRRTCVEVYGEVEPCTTNFLEKNRAPKRMNVVVPILGQRISTIGQKISFDLCTLDLQDIKGLITEFSTKYIRI
jgi:hypothetical protein